MITVAALSGGTEEHLCGIDELGCSVHVEVVAPLRRLRERAAAAGFDLRVASGFRSFSRQQAIWNAKAGGERPVYDSDGQPVDIQRLPEWELVQAILRWSALPGASRHHWGTDMDIFDAAAVPADYRLQLTVEETTGQGPFAALHRWLDEWLPSVGEGFFRPYGRDRGGVAVEPWHLSFAPVACRFQRALDVRQLRAIVANADIGLKQTVLDNLDEIFERFVRVPWEAYPPFIDNCQ